jgi:hypothetical protein
MFGLRGAACHQRRHAAQRGSVLRVNERQIDHRATTVLPPAAEACAEAGVERSRGLGGGCLSHETLFGSSSAVQRLGTRVTTLARGLLSPFDLRRWTFVPLAGLEPATCCLGDGSAQTLCSTTNLLVGGDREAKVISSSDRREMSRYPARTLSAGSGHVHTPVPPVYGAVSRSLSLGESSPHSPRGRERPRRKTRFARLMHRPVRDVGGPSARAASGDNLSLLLLSVVSHDHCAANPDGAL